MSVAAPDLLKINQKAGEEHQERQKAIAQQAEALSQQDIENLRADSPFAQILEKQNSGETINLDDQLYLLSTRNAHNRWLEGNLEKRRPGPDRKFSNLDGKEIEFHPGFLPIEFMRDVYAGKIIATNFREKLNDFQLNNPNHPFAEIDLGYLEELSEEDEAFYVRWVKRILQRWATANDNYYFFQKEKLQQLGLTLGELTDPQIRNLLELAGKLKEFNQKIKSKDTSVEEIGEMLTDPENREVLLMMLQDHQDWRGDSTYIRPRLDDGDINLFEQGRNLKIRNDEWIKTRLTVLQHLSSDEDLEEYQNVAGLQDHRDRWHRELDSEGNAHYFAEQTFAGMYYLLQQFQDILEQLKNHQNSKKSKEVVIRTARFRGKKIQKLIPIFEKLIAQLKQDFAADANPAVIESIIEMDKEIKSNSKPQLLEAA